MSSSDRGLFGLSEEEILRGDGIRAAMSPPVELTLGPIARGTDGGTGYRWYAAWGDGYDAAGVTIEDALAALVRTLGEALAEAEARLDR